jgi:hypothetical protein
MLSSRTQGTRDSPHSVVFERVLCPGKKFLGARNQDTRDKYRICRDMSQDKCNQANTGDRRTN